MANRLANNVKEGDVLPLRQQEIDLIFLLRNEYKFGTVEILVRDGLPVDLLQTVKRVRLGSLSTDTLDNH